MLNCYFGAKLHKFLGGRKYFTGYGLGKLICPYDFIKSIVRKTIEKLNAESVENLSDNVTKCVSIPYVKGLFEKIKKTF